MYNYKLFFIIYVLFIHNINCITDTYIDFLISNLSKNGTSITKNLQHLNIPDNHKHLIIKRIKEKIIKINNIYNSLNNNSEIITVTPVLKWAQNNTHILLNIKLSHRYDAPGCMNIINSNINYNGDTNKLEFNINCIQTNQNINFDLNFEFYNYIHKIATNNTNDGNNIEIFLEKYEYDIWEDLYKNYYERKKIRTKIWNEIADLYKEDMDKFFDLFDEYEEKF